MEQKRKRKHHRRSFASNAQMQKCVGVGGRRCEWKYCKHARLPSTLWASICGIVRLRVKQATHGQKKKKKWGQNHQTISLPLSSNHLFPPEPALFNRRAVTHTTFLPPLAYMPKSNGGLKAEFAQKNLKPSSVCHHHNPIVEVVARRKRVKWQFWVNCPFKIAFILIPQANFCRHRVELR